MPKTKLIDPSPVEREIDWCLYRLEQRGHDPAAIGRAALDLAVEYMVRRLGGPRTRAELRKFNAGLDKVVAGLQRTYSAPPPAA